jgi:hypothetical protein
VRWVVEDGRKVGLEYRGTQGSTDGIGNRIERFDEFVLERTYVGRLNIAGTAARTEMLDQLLDRSPRYKELFRVSPHPAYMIEAQTKDYWVLMVGDNFSTHFHRWDTLRVWMNGRIEIENTIEDGWRTEVAAMR